MSEEQILQNEEVIEDAVAEKVVAEETVAEETVKVEAAEEAVEEAVAEEAVAEEAVAEETTTTTEEPTETMDDYKENLDDANPWNLVKAYMQDGTNLPVTIEGVVNGGAITTVEGLRGFVPASKLSLSYIEDLETYLTKEIKVRVIDVDQKNNRLVLSAREILKEEEKEAQKERLNNLPVGSVVKGVVESLQSYGAFVRLEDGLSGLIHVSQISDKRIKEPGDVLKLKEEVTSKIIGIKDGKISLSIKALKEPADGKPSRGDRGDRGGRSYEPREKVVIPKAENIGTSLADLFKDIKL